MRLSVSGKHLDDRPDRALVAEEPPRQVRAGLGVRVPRDPVGTLNRELRGIVQMAGVRQAVRRGRAPRDARRIRRARVRLLSRVSGLVAGAATRAGTSGSGGLRAVAERPALRLAVGAPTPGTRRSTRRRPLSQAPSVWRTCAFVRFQRRTAGAGRPRAPCRSAAARLHLQRPRAPRGSVAARGTRARPRRTTPRRIATPCRGVLRPLRRVSFAQTSCSKREQLAAARAGASSAPANNLPHLSVSESFTFALRRVARSALRIRSELGPFGDDPSLLRCAALVFPSFD